MSEVRIYIQVVNVAVAGRTVGRDVDADDPCDGYMVSGGGDHPVPRVGETLSIIRAPAPDGQRETRHYRVVSVQYSVDLGAKCDVWLYCEFIDANRELTVF